MNWTRYVKCSKCGCSFMMEQEDMIIAFSAEEEMTKRFVICPDCYEHIKLEVET